VVLLYTVAIVYALFMNVETKKNNEYIIEGKYIKLVEVEKDDVDIKFHNGDSIEVNIVNNELHWSYKNKKTPRPTFSTKPKLSTKNPIKTKSPTKTKTKTPTKTKFPKATSKSRN
jgi:competence transcription factor ComK